MAAVNNNIHQDINQGTAADYWSLAIQLDAHVAPDGSLWPSLRELAMKRLQIVDDGNSHVIPKANAQYPKPLREGNRPMNPLVAFTRAAMTAQVITDRLEHLKRKGAPGYERPDVKRLRVLKKAERKRRKANRGR